MSTAWRSAVCSASLLLFALFPAAQDAEAAKKHDIHPGYRTLSSSLPDERIMLSLGVWYPTARHAGTVKAGDWTFRAARNAAVLEGKWPVVVLSHDVTGSSWSYHHLAGALASHGFIVIAPTHDLDNAEDMRLFLTEKELPFRALQISASLDLVLANDRIGPKVDLDRIAYLGFGTPSPAGLLLAGGRLTPDGWAGLCPSKGGLEGLETDGAASDLAGLFGADSPWCSPYMRERMDSLTASMRDRAAGRLEKERLMLGATASREQLFERLSDTVARGHQRQLRLAKTEDIPSPPVALPLLPPLSQEQDVADGRFKAFIFVSPGFSMLFSKDSLQQVECPAFFIGAGKDVLNRPAEQAERFAYLLGGNAEYLLLPQADAPAFMAACPSADPAFPLSEISRSVPAETRTAIHTRLFSVVLDFLHRTLGR